MTLTCFMEINSTKSVVHGNERNLLIHITEGLLSMISSISHRWRYLCLFIHRSPGTFWMHAYYEEFYLIDCFMKNNYYLILCRNCFYNSMHKYFFHYYQLRFKFLKLVVVTFRDEFGLSFRISSLTKSQYFKSEP